MISTRPFDTLALREYTIPALASIGLPARLLTNVPSAWTMTRSFTGAAASSSASAARFPWSNTAWRSRSHAACTSSPSRWARWWIWGH